MTQVSELGGAERACLALSRWLTTQNIPNHFVTYYETAGLAQVASSLLEVVQLKPPLRPIAKIAALTRYFQVHGNQYQPLMSGYQPALHATLAGVHGFHCLMHDTPSLFSDGVRARAPRSRALRWVSDQITGHGLRSGGNTVVTSEYLRQESRRVFHVDAIVARMGGLGSTSTFRPRPAGATLHMLSVSRVEANKRIDWMLNALAAMENTTQPLSSTVDWRLDVAGRGSQLEAMRQASARLGLEHRVQFHGFISDAELELLYAQADLFLMPAVQGYGIPAIESLQRGIPVLLHRDSGVSDILLHTPWATIIDGGEDAMLPALQQAIASVRGNLQLNAALPDIPTEDRWAEQVAAVCGWI